MTGTTPTVTGTSNRPLIGAGAGTFIEFYDFAIYALTVPVIADQIFPEGNPGVALISAFAVYGVAFVIRPLGGVIFGAVGDRYGRRRVLTLVLTLIGVATALIGVLPTYSDVGLLAPLLLVALRLVQGLSAGGEVTSATSFALEHAPARHRSLWITLVVVTSALSSIAGLLVVLGLNAAMPEAARPGSTTTRSSPWRAAAGTPRLHGGPARRSHARHMSDKREPADLCHPGAALPHPTAASGSTRWTGASTDYAGRADGAARWADASATSVVLRPAWRPTRPAATSSARRGSSPSSARAR